MNPTASLALQRARARQSGQKRSALSPKPRMAAAAPAEPAAPTPAPQRAAPEASPRLDRVLFLEGQRAARDLLSSMQGLLTSRAAAAVALDRLRGIAQANPASYGAGVLSIVEAVEQLLPQIETEAPPDMAE